MDALQLYKLAQQNNLQQGILDMQRQQQFGTVAPEQSALSSGLATLGEAAKPFFMKGADKRSVMDQIPTGYLDGTTQQGQPFDMQNMQNQVEMLMNMMPGAGIGGVIKRIRGPVGDAIRGLPQRGGKIVGAPHDLNITPQKMPWISGQFEQMADEGKNAWDWYFSGGRSIKEWFAPKNVNDALTTTAGMSPQAPVDLNAKFMVKAMNQHNLGQRMDAGMVPSQARNMIEPILKGEKQNLFQTVKDAQKVPSFYVNLKHGAGFPLQPEDMLRSTQDRWMLRAGRFKGAMSNNSYRYLSAITQDVAKSMGLLPHQVQAGVWTSLKARWESVAPEIQKKYVKRGMMRKSKIKNKKTGKREPIGPWEIKPENARQYNDEIFKKAIKADLPSSAFDEAGRSFDYFFEKMSKKYSKHTFSELEPILTKEGRVAPLDQQGIPHRMNKGQLELLEPKFEGVPDPSSVTQNNKVFELINEWLRGNEYTGFLGK